MKMNRMNARTLFVTVVVSVAGATARLRPLAERSRMIVVTHVWSKNVVVVKVVPRKKKSKFLVYN